VRTAEVITTILSAEESNTPYGRRSFSVLSNPQFLADGIAISDLEQPDRVLVGGLWVTAEQSRSIRIFRDALIQIYLGS